MSVNTAEYKDSRNPVEMDTEKKSLEEETAAGYISIKDYAYQESDPLHYGYFEESSDDEGNKENIKNCEGTGDGLFDKRQSMILPSDYIVNHKAVAIYDFIPENDNELALKEGDVVYISYKHGQGWLVAENEERTKTGLVPEEYVSFIEDDEDTQSGAEEEARPFYLTHFITQNMGKTTSNERTNDEDEWEDIDDVETDIKDNLKISN